MDVPLPLDACPTGGGLLEEDRVAFISTTELPERP
jgi:hypothetical protein